MPQKTVNTPQTVDISRNQLVHGLLSDDTDSSRQEVDNAIENVKGFSQGVRNYFLENNVTLKADTIIAENGTKGIVDAAVPYSVRGSFLGFNTKIYSGIQDGFDYATAAANAAIFGFMGKFIGPLLGVSLARLKLIPAAKALNEARLAIRNAHRQALVPSFEASVADASPQAKALMSRFTKRAGWVGIAVGAVAGLAYTAWETGFWKNYFKSKVVDLRELDNGYDDHLIAPAEAQE